MQTLSQGKKKNLQLLTARGSARGRVFFFFFNFLFGANKEKPVDLLDCLSVTGEAWVTWWVGAMLQAW